MFLRSRFRVASNACASRLRLVSSQVTTGSVDLNVDGLPVDPSTRRKTLGEVTLQEIATQAKSLQLTQLSAECEQALNDIRASAVSIPPTPDKKIFKLQIEFEDTPVVRSLHQLWRPIHFTGSMKAGDFNLPLFKKTSFDCVDLSMLIATAKRIRLPTQPVSANVFEIGAFLLSEKTLEVIANSIDVTPLYPDRFTALRPRMLQILNEGSSNHSISPALGQDDVLGTVEVILNSEYTGGELQVMCDGQVNKLKTCPYDWVAVHADASCSISPVTSGARVSLVYDIIAVSNVCIGQRLANWSISFSTADGNIQVFSHVTTISVNVDKLIHIAKQLAPQETSTNAFQIDGFLCDDEAVQRLLRPVVELNSSRCKRELVLRTNRLEVHLPGASFRRTYDHSDTTGYVGSMLAIFKSAFHNRGSESIYVEEKVQDWVTCDGFYTVPAGAVHEMKAITSGQRVALVCDIFDARMVSAQAAETDPLLYLNSSTVTDGDTTNSYVDRASDGEGEFSDITFDTDIDYADIGFTDSDGCEYNDDSGSDGDSSNNDQEATYVNHSDHKCLLMTRGTASATMRDTVLTAIASALEGYDAVIITLQGVYVRGCYALTDVVLQGGDRALYDILTNSATDTNNGATTNTIANTYDVEVIDVTLKATFDSLSSKYVLSEGTATLENNMSAKLLIPTKITLAHRAWYRKHTYNVQCLKVTRKERQG